MESLLQAKQLFCERDRRVLFNDLNFDINSGEVLQVEGPNGSGKTTLLRILTGLSDAYEGEVLWNGKSIRSHRANYLTQTQYLGHLAGIKQTLSAQENLSWYASARGFASLKNIDLVLDRMGLRGYEDIPCYKMSAGQQRRVNLARLLLMPAKLWILDEPFTAIDKKGVELIEQLLCEQVNSGGAVIITTHQPLSKVSGLRKITLGAAL